jgi:hypothetical protein
MSWHHFYRLLDKYHGDIQAATAQEIDMARKFSENPQADLQQAVEKYEQVNGQL